MTFDLGAAFHLKQNLLQASLGMTEVTTHPTDKGDIAEESWREMFRTILPTRYGVTRATIVDAQGGQSDSIDLVIHDRHFSPLVFQQNDITYLPAESVYGVFEIKPELSKSTLDYAGDKAASVRALVRTSFQIVHAGGVIQDPKAPPAILAGLLTARAGWNPAFGSSFGEHLSGEGGTRLDLGCVASEGAWELPLGAADPLVSVGSETSLIFFVLRLLARLQAMGSVPAMDYDIWGSVLNSN